ncbi:FtsQ-type POTRA domain-containing protein [Clostridium estertheticum]|uniref:cell division protein FtsQ/DivIB n=1 Tax=Clostridium estertheticum TaxID=238834 RepID=UPI0013EE8735|nr:FtsQ-type POTRA domain-containing protein [Clostridium estertheticum]MBZ9608426.1 FtsQ-type POTRA domain-containing protein [Clostridium estertheticum]
MTKKSNNLKKGNYIIKNKEKLLHRRKSKKKVKYLMLLVIIMISTLITLCIKLPYFNIETIEIVGNMNASKVEINDTASIHLGGNIFSESFNDSKQQIMKNPYIVGVKVRKDLPNKIVIEIEERVAVFYGKLNNAYYILDNKGILLEKRSNVKDMNLVNLIGFNFEKCEVGNLIASKDDRKINIAVEITNIINDYRKNKGNNIITMVDVSNVLDIKVYAGEMCIKFGTSEDLKNKFNKSINIITEPQYKSAKGYVDVSSKSNPVVFIEQKGKK